MFGSYSLRSLTVNSLHSSRATSGTSPPNDRETNETIVFGYLVAWFFGACEGHFLL
ncbi:hypothetical protein C8J56DRAFT_974066 [Mycena floridula]|nr:hypothetical protein C8J56DRAFT_974066 [Mycena floridula]